MPPESPTIAPLLLQRHAHDLHVEEGNPPLYYGFMEVA
jgi:hypothetical protein